MNPQLILCRRGITFIEILTTIVIIAAMSGLLLPAIQHARETARSASCATNLQQLGLALAGFEAGHGTFPPSKLAAVGREQGLCDPFESEVEDNPGQCTAHESWTPICLDYLEHAALARAYRPDDSWSSLRNRAAVQSQLSVFTCPSAPRIDRVDKYFVRGAAATDYVIVSQVEAATYVDVFGVPDPGVEARQGVLAEYVNTPAQRITDGMSRTILLAESAGRPMVYAFGKLCDDKTIAVFAGDEAIKADGYWVPDDGIGWADPESVISVKGTMEQSLEPFGPRMINAHNLGEAYGFHRRRAVFLFADGSVHSLQEAIDPWVYVSLCTRAGGEVVDVAP